PPPSLYTLSLHDALPIYLVELDELTGIFRLRAPPDLLHRLDALAHQLEARGERRAMVGHLLFVPAAADAEQQPAVRQPVDGGNRSEEHTSELQSLAYLVC